MFRLEIVDDTIREVEWEHIREHITILLRDIFFRNHTPLRYVKAKLKMHYAYARRHHYEIWIHLLMDHPLLDSGPLVSVILTFRVASSEVLLIVPTIAEVSGIGLTKAVCRFQYGVWIQEFLAENKSPHSELF